MPDLRAPLHYRVAPPFELAKIRLAVERAEHVLLDSQRVMQRRPRSQIV